MIAGAKVNYVGPVNNVIVAYDGKKGGSLLLLPRSVAPDLVQDQFIKVNIDDVTKRVTLVTDE